MLITSFLFLDWHFVIFNLPYKPEEELKPLSEPDNNKHSRCSRVTPLNVIPDLNSSEIVEKSKWYINISRRHGIWEHILSPVYIMLVLFTSMVLLPTIFLSVIWYPWVYYITDNNESLCKLSQTDLDRETILIVFIWINQIRRLHSVLSIVLNYFFYMF
jgi:hypothetical protein